MEEAEALCERVGIFVNGEMRSIGTPSRLKSTFGQNLKLTLTTAPEDEQKAHDLVMKLCPQATVFNR
jgi:ABC-type multidrug transport system ATPase subunit